MVTPESLDYVRRQLQSGVSEETVRSALAEGGWGEDAIAELFNEVHGGPAPEPQQTPAPQTPDTSHMQAPVSDTAFVPVGQLFREAWRLSMQRFGILVALYAVPILVMAAGAMLAAAGYGIALVPIFIGAVLALPSGLAAVFALARGTGFAESFTQGLRLFFPALWLGILSLLVVSGGMVMLVVPAILMGIWFIFSSFTFVLEGKRGLQALLQSREYARGYWWAIFGRVLLLQIVLSVIIGILMGVASAVFGSVAGSLVSMACDLFVIPFSLAYTYRMYQSLAALKPALPASTPAKGRGFLIASAVLGLLFPFLIIAAAILFAATSHTNNHTPPLSATSTEMMATSSPLTASSTPAATSTSAGVSAGTSTSTHTTIE
jgi:hypothetical protein